MDLFEIAKENIGEENAKTLVEANRECVHKLMDVVQGAIDKFSDKEGNTDLAAVYGIIGAVGEVAAALIASNQNDRRDKICEDFCTSLRAAVVEYSNKLDKAKMN
jgi:hypothetical protein